MNILFVCKYNRFRSKVAEYYFNKINNKKDIKVKSAGIFVGSYPLSKRQKAAGKDIGIKLKGKPQPISTKLLKWQDLIVIISDDIPVKLFNPKVYNNKIIVWKIKDDIPGGDIKRTKKLMKKIMENVEKLNKDLSNGR